MSLCKWKNIFGEPGKGFHKDRIFGLALWDLVGTIIIIIILSHYMDHAIIIIPLATILIHKLFCVDTAFNKAIGI